MEQRKFSLTRTLKVLFELNSLEQNLKKLREEEAITSRYSASKAISSTKYFYCKED